MKNNLINLLITTLLLFMFAFIFVYSNDTKNAVIYAENIWLTNLIPSIFPSLIIVSLLIKFNVMAKLNNIFKIIICKIYNLPKEASFIVILSMITGFPTGSKYIKDLLDKDMIDLDVANHLITFTSYSNPIFVITFIGEHLLNNKKLGIIIYLIHLLSGLIIGILFKNKSSINTKINDTNISQNNSFIKSLVDSIKEAFNILLNMLGIIIFFLILISIIDKIMPSNILTKIIESLIEITIGITNISKLKISIRLKVSIIGMILSFNGLCVHFQTKSIIEGSKIKYAKYFLARVLHSVLCFILLYCFFYIFI